MQIQCSPDLGKLPFLQNKPQFQSELPSQSSCAGVDVLRHKVAQFQPETLEENKWV